MFLNSERCESTGPESDADHADPEKAQNKIIYFDLFTVKINNLLLENAFSVIN